MNKGRWGYDVARGCGNPFIAHIHVNLAFGLMKATHKVRDGLFVSKLPHLFEYFKKKKMKTVFVLSIATHLANQWVFMLFCIIDGNF